MKRKVNVRRVVLFVLGVLVISFGLFLLLQNKDKMIDLKNKSIEEVNQYVNDHKLKLVTTYEYSEIPKDHIVSQSIDINSNLKKDMTLEVVISKGIDYESYKVNELGSVPIMMYHGIHNMKNSETDYTGGNVDSAGYQRTSEAFIADLEFYYTSGYRMIHLNDYINGIVDVPLGKSPIIITFDDGLANNIKVTGLDKDGNIIIDPNSAVGILESFKQKYPDFNVTATFFVNGGLFNQSEYNEKILKWLVDNGYDVGNHTYSHADFTKISTSDSTRDVALVYKQLEAILGKKFVNIIALPFGSPYNKDHSNFPYILEGNFNGYEYKTDCTLRVGWESETSPFHKSFDSKFLKRIRAYDNNGEEFDIEMNFKLLENNRYISDGKKDTVSISSKNEAKIGSTYNLEVVKY